MLILHLTDEQLARFGCETANDVHELLDLAGAPRRLAELQTRATARIVEIEARVADLEARLVAHRAQQLDRDSLRREAIASCAETLRRFSTQ